MNKKAASNILIILLIIGGIWALSTYNRVTSSDTYQDYEYCQSIGYDGVSTSINGIPPTEQTCIGPTHKWVEFRQACCSN